MNIDLELCFWPEFVPSKKFVAVLIICFNSLLVLSDEPYGNWPSSGAVRGRLSPGFGYGRWQFFVDLLAVLISNINLAVLILL